MAAETRHGVSRLLAQGRGEQAVLSQGGGFTQQPGSGAPYLTASPHWVVAPSHRQARCLLMPEPSSMMMSSTD
jgi:hypothetical protein